MLLNCNKNLLKNNKLLLFNGKHMEYLVKKRNPTGF